MNHLSEKNEWIKNSSQLSIDHSFQIQCAYALGSTYFESLFEFSFVHLVLDTFFRFPFVCHPLLFCLFLTCLACLFHWVCNSIFHLMLSNSSIWVFLTFLLCYSYVEECECSWFIWFETHWFGNFVGDYLILKVKLRWRRNCEKKQSEWLCCEEHTRVSGTWEHYSDVGRSAPRENS